MKLSFRLSMLVAAAIAIPAASQEIVHARRLPDGNLRELAKLVLPEQEPRVKRHRFLLPIGSHSSTATSHPPIRATATIPAPPVALGFTSGTSRQIGPADASGAVGPNHVVGAYNNGVVVHDRSGKILAAVTQRQFWATSQALGDQYDPRIAYDASRDRWVMIAVDREEALLFAVSETGDPTGTWRRYDAGLITDYVDFTRIAVTRDTVMLMTVVGWANTNARVLSINKNDLYGGAEPMRMKSYLESDAGTVPVQAESIATEYVVSHSPGSITVKRLGSNASDVIGTPRWLRTFETYLPQLATSAELLSGWPQIENAVYRNGSIYSVITVEGEGNATGVAWCRFDVETKEAEWGLVSDPEGQTYYAYPSIAVNDRGEMLIGMGTFSARQYPTASYVFRDMLGRMSYPGLIRAGDSPFTENDRWGDYTTTVADPVEPGVFWTVQITTNKGAWGTVWARVEQPASTRRRATRH